MPSVMSGRYTANHSESFVVFLIGMRINRWCAFRKWIPTVRAMMPMIQALQQYPEKGFLGGEAFLYWRGVGFIQYWKSFEDLEKFARNPLDSHLSAWRDFNRNIGADGSVGIWHETYRIEQGQYESVYGNMPIFGLAAATNHVAVNKQSETARKRIRKAHQLTSIEE